jgi:hypothetical protein
MSVVVIARSDQAVGLRKRFGAEADVALFSDCDSLKAIDAILAHPPKILALDRAFATTARAASLVARLRSEPHLRATDVRVLAEDEMNLPVLLSSRVPGLEGALMRASYPLDYCGTRRAPRFVATEDVHVLVNGEQGRLIDLSCIGVQLVATARLRPEEPLRVALVDPSVEVRVRGVVAWSVVVPSGTQLAYRAGVEFIDPDSLTLEAFCVRNIASPARTSSTA